MRDTGEQMDIRRKSVQREHRNRHIDFEALENPVPSFFVREKLRTNAKQSS